MEQPPMPQPGQQGYVDPMMTNVGYIPQQNIQMDPVMSKHLDFSNTLDRLKNMLMGREYNDEEDEWKPATIMVYNDKGEPIEVEEGPMMEPRSIRTIIGFLEMFLNPNLFLSQLDDERINDIMWDVNTKLFAMFYNLRYKLTPKERGPLWASIEYPILFGLCRARQKITLDAVSKSMISHEMIQATPRAPTAENKEFKVLGW